MTAPLPERNVLQGDEALARFSKILLTLYDGCLEQRLDTFQDWAFELTQPLIPFDAAYWGGGRWREGSLPDHHHVHLYTPCAERIPAVFDETRPTPQALELNTRLCAHAGHSLIERMTPLSGFHTFFQHVGAQQMLCQYRYDHLPGIFQIISLYRHDNESPFTEHERQWHQALVPHLLETFRRNRLHHMGFNVEQCRSGLPRAVSDPKGVLRLADPRFIALMQKEWPGWTGPDLPPALWALEAAEGKSHFQGKKITLHAQPFHELLLLESRPRHALDGLTQRELEIADHYAAGRSHMEIAREVDLTQATVRNYLSNVYLKLGVNNKAQLALLLNEQAGGGHWQRCCRKP